VATKTANNSSSMAELMARYTSPLVTFRKGQEVEGVITKLTPSEILLDLHAKTEAVVLEKEKTYIRAMLSFLHVGDKVKAMVLNPESDTGNAVVSLRKFIDEKQWEVLATVQKEHEKIEVTVTGTTKGGYLVTTQQVRLPGLGNVGQGIEGFLPNSHISQLAPHVGNSISVMIAELDPKVKKLIVSQKTILGEEEFEQLAKSLKTGEKVTGVVSYIAAFGVFVTISVGETRLDGFVHISEISWDKVSDINEVLAMGQTIDAIALGFDKTAKRIDLSIKRLTKDPFENIMKEFPVDKKVTGTVEKITDAGVIINLGIAGVEGIIRKEKIPPTVTYKEGQKIPLTVSQIEAKKHRILLTPVLLEKPLTYR